jgi:hypothetical protein
MTRFRVSRKPPDTPKGPWLQVSHQMTWAIEDMADRDDLVVKISPTAGFDDSAYDEDGNLRVFTKEMADAAKQKVAAMGHPDKKKIFKEIEENIGKPVADQHPGVTFPATGIVEINGKYVPEDVDPSSMNPLIREDRKRYPVVWGLLGHEAAHAHFSMWMDEADEKMKARKLSEDEKKYVGAATILEESRIEKRQMGFRPQDQVWLHASGTKLALEEVTKQMRAAKKMLSELGLTEAEFNKIMVARSAALVLARIDAGSVEPDDATNEIQALVDTMFGDDAAKLRDIWLEAQATGDYDYPKMMALGKAWYELTGDAGQDHQEGDEGGGQGDNDGDQNALAQALAQAAENGEKEANGQAEVDRNSQRIAKAYGKRRDEAKAQQEANQQARATFAGKGNNYNHPVRGYRDPTATELSLARMTRRALQAAYVPERAMTQMDRSLPPGRLSMRAAQQLDAELQAGLLPDVEPFKFKDRKHVPTPPLKVAIIQDVSGSQGAAAAAAVSGAWSLAKAAQMITDAQVAMVTFGDAVHGIIKPFERVPKVPVLSTNYGTDYFLQALQAVEGALQLTRSGSARLVVILTDGMWSHRDSQGRDPALKRLTEQGVKFLWLTTDGGSDARYHPGKIKGVHVFTKAAGNFEAVPRVIATEAVNALKKPL